MPIKSFPSHLTHDLPLFWTQPDTSTHFQTVHRYRILRLCWYPEYISNKDGQAGLTWVVGYIPRGLTWPQSQH